MPLTMTRVSSTDEPWRQVGLFSVGAAGPVLVLERLWHAGLSQDGSYCFVAETEDIAYLVWDIERSVIVWAEDSTQIDTSRYPELEDWVKEGIIEIEDGPGQGCYRIFGVEQNFAKVEDSARGLCLRTNVQEKALIIQDSVSGNTLQWLTFADDSGDWAFASFSENGSTVAVLTPYYVTFFRSEGQYLP